MGKIIQLRKTSFYTLLLMSLLCLLMIGRSSAQQIQIILNPFTGYGFNLDQIGQTTFINGSKMHYKVYLSYDIRLPNSALVCEVVTSPFDLAPGTQQLKGELNLNDHISFGNNSQAFSLSMTNLLPTGNYLFDLTLYNAANNTVLALYTEEREYKINNFPPHLRYPYNQDSITTLTPDLQWIPPIPTTGDMLFELQLVENINGENPYNAILHNIYLVDVKGLTGDDMQYPFNAPALEYGHTYAWQVHAYIGSEEIGKTEVWQFTPVEHKFLDTPPIPKKKPDHPYWILSNKQDGGYYDAFGKVGLSFINKTIDTVLNYHIRDIANPNARIESLPHIKIHKGLNQVKIALDNNPAFLDNKQYVLSIALSDGNSYKVRFTYHHDD